MSKHTPGPWYVDRACNIWRRDPSDLYQNGGSVAGDRPIATVNKGWYGSGETGFPVEANARLISAAPDLLTELRQAISQMEMAAECIEAGRLSEALLHVSSLMHTKKAAIAKATGEQP